MLVLPQPSFCRLSPCFPERLAALPRRPAAFTLIELLIVLAIIASLAAILFPVFVHAREKARQTACVSNLRQVGAALQLYSHDYDETLPGNTLGAPHNIAGDAGLATVTPIGFKDTDPSRVARNWARDLLPYIANTQAYLCPNAAPRSDISANSPYEETTDPRGANVSYLLNGVIASQHLAVIPNPADIILMHEYQGISRVAQLRPCPTDATGLTWNLVNDPLHEKQHAFGLSGNGSLFLFSDGHVAWQRKVNTRFRQFGVDTASNPNTANNPDRTLSDTVAPEKAEGTWVFRSLFPPPPR
jgi:prepilin-type N-terminal cleavage/methylation domain-containing protein